MPDLTLEDKINIMRAKKEGANILIRPHQQTEMADGNAPWSRIEEPEFNWSVADYKVESDKEELLRKVKETVDCNRMYNSIHAFERGKNLPNIVTYSSSILTDTKTETLENVNNFILENTSALLSFDLETFKQTDAYQRIYTSLYNEYFDKARRDIDNNPSLLNTYGTNDAYYDAVYKPQVDEIIMAMLQELNNTLATICGPTLSSSINDIVTRSFDRNIFELKAKTEDDFIPSTTYSSPEEIRERIDNHLQTACEKYLENDTRIYSVSHDENLNVTIVRDIDNMVPTVSVSLVADKQNFYDDNVPAIDYEIISDKISNISNITSEQLASLNSQITSIANRVDEFDTDISVQVRDYVNGEIPTIKSTLSNLSTTINNNYQELITSIREMKSNTTITKPIAYQGAGYTKTVIDFIDNTNDNYGHGMLIGGEGSVVIGSGESVKAVKDNYGIAANSENMLVTGDENVNILTNLQGGYNGKKEFVFGKDGSLTVPGNINVTSINGIEIRIIE